MEKVFRRVENFRGFRPNVRRRSAERGVVFGRKHRHASHESSEMNMAARVTNSVPGGPEPLPDPLSGWRAVPLFAGCTAAQLEALARHVEIVSCQRHQDLYREGDPARHIHIVLKGEIGLEKTRGAGAEPMRLSIMRPGECFGIGEFMLPVYHTTATALSEGELLRIAAPDFRRYFLAIESIRDRVLAELSRIAKFLLFAVVAGSGANMLAFYLRRLCLENADETDGEFHIRTKVLQPEIASLLNLSREHVTRLFARLQEQGVVDFNRGFPVVDKAWLLNAVPDTDLADFIVYRDYPR